MTTPRSVGLNKDDLDRPCYVFIRFERSLIQAFKNRMIASKSIIRNYSGMWLSVAPDIHVKEGSWSKNRTIGVLFFKSVREAVMYLDSDPSIKQPDFVNGVDILIVPMEHVPQAEKPIFCLIDLCVHDNEEFCNKYVPGHMPSLKASGAAPAVCATRRFDKRRGLWAPEMIVVHQWAKMEEFENWYNGEDYKPWKEIRQSISSANIIVFENDYCERCVNS